MSRRCRFEIVHTAAGWHSRFIAANGQTVWVTESYRRRTDAVRATRILRRALTTDAMSGDREVDER